MCPGEGCYDRTIEIWIGLCPGTGYNVQHCCDVIVFASENRGEFLEKLQRARSQVKAGMVSQPVLSSPGPTRIMVGNWSLTCRKEGQLQIHNSDGQQQCTVLREDLPGFVFESNRGTKHSFTAETSLGPEFAAVWPGRKNKKFRSKVEEVKQKVLGFDKFWIDVAMN